MADNVPITAGVGTSIAADDIASVWYQRVKIALGEDGAAVDAIAGAGVVGTGVQRTTLASDDPAVTALQLLDDAVFTDDAAFTPGTSKGLAIGFQADETSPDSVDEGDFGVPRMTLARHIIVAPRSPFVTASVDITRPADTTTYASGDALSDSTSAPTSGGFTLTGLGRASGGAGIITDLLVISTIVGSTAVMLQGEILLFDTAVTNVNDNAALTVTDAEAKTLIGTIPFTLVPNGVAASALNCRLHIPNLGIGYTCIGSANLRFLIHVKNAYVPASAEVITVRAKAILVD